MPFTSDAAFEFKTNFMDRIKNANSSTDDQTDGQIDSGTETPATTASPPQFDAQDFKGRWVNEVKANASTEQQSSGGGQDFDTQWGYNAGSAPKYESHDSDVRKRNAGLDYSVQQDRNYWAAKADSVRGETYGDPWKNQAPQWERWEEPEEIKTTWQDKEDDKKNN